MATVQTNVADDVVAAAFDDPNPQSIIIGQGKLALNADHYSDEDTLESNTYAAMRNNSFTTSPSSMAPLQGMPAIRRGNRSQFKAGHLSYETESPDQLHLSVANRAVEDADSPPAHKFHQHPARSSKPDQAGGVAP